MGRKKKSKDLDDERVKRAIGFIQNLTHTKGRWAGVQFDLIKWQHNLICELFGRVRNGVRQYRTCYCEVPKKNGKSELAAAVALLLLVADGEQGGEVYSAAADRDQASIVFNVAAQMVRNNAILSKRLKIIDSQKRIIDHKTGSFYRVISAEAYTKHGFNASGIIFDELHTQPTRDLWDVLTLGSGDAREQPLTFAITTAGYDRQSVCWEQHEYALKVLNGTVQDHTFLPVVYSVPEDVDWENEKYWKSANPSLGEILDIENLRNQYRKAKETPALQNAFRRLRLNQWTQQSNRWIDLSLWDENGQDVDEDSLLGRTCYGGLDLSSVSDLTAWVMVFPRDEDQEHLNVVSRFWCPEARLDDSRNKYRDQYRVWKDQGFLKVTPGNAVDYQFIKHEVMLDAQRFNLVDLNVDRLFQGHQISMELAEEGLSVIAMGMGWRSMAAPMNELHRRLLSRQINHRRNPIMRWMVDNLAVQQDPAGNLKPDKAESQGKIDGIVSLVMALDRAMRNTEQRSVYESRGVIAI